MASSTAAIFIFFYSPSAATIVIASWAKIIRVTTCTETYVLRKIIVNSFTVVMTPNTRDTEMMITWVIGIGSMSIIDRPPSLCIMTNATLLRRHEMRR